MRLKCYNYNEQMRPEHPQVVRGKQEVANITIGETKKSGNGGENQEVHGDRESGGVVPCRVGVPYVGRVWRHELLSSWDIHGCDGDASWSACGS